MARQEFDDVTSKLDEVFLPAGFEVYPFKVGWYNAAVAPPFLLDYPLDTVAFVVISSPSFFEKAFLPFVRTEEVANTARDPLDQCIVQHFTLAREALGSRPLRTLHDFDLTHARRPLVLVQTAGHVAGAARYYQRSDIINDPWASDKKIFGVSIHPRYGGWFALRGVLILPDLQYPDMPQRTPPEVLPDEAQQIELLNRYNDNWQDWTFRDIIPVVDRYMELQKLYFATPSRDRKQLMQRLRAAATGAG